MLKIIKKEEIKAQDIESSYSLEYEIEEKALKIVRETTHIKFGDIEDYLAQLPSISAALLAEIIQKIINSIEEDSIHEALTFIFKLMALQQ
jgi:hypothetical protein